MSTTRRKDPARARYRAFAGLIALFVCSTGAACDHAAQESRLLGEWEGLIPVPATGEQIPITYHFREDGLSVGIGLPGNASVQTWVRWEVHSVVDGDLVVYVYRDDGRVFSTLVRIFGEDELMLWDAGTEESTAARVRRRQSARSAPIPSGTGSSLPGE